MTEQKIKEMFKRERLKQKLKLYHVTKGCGIKNTHLKNWEDTEVSFTVPIFLKLADFLGYDVNITKRK